MTKLEELKAARDAACDVYYDAAYDAADAAACDAYKAAANEAYAAYQAELNKPKEQTDD